MRRRDAHVSKFCLWEEYRKAHPNGYEYSWFCREYRAWAETVEPVMRKQHRGGYATFVDYAGDTVKVVNSRTGEVTEAQVFIGVMGASNYTFAEATWDQALPSWIGSDSVPRKWCKFFQVPVLWRLDRSVQRRRSGAFNDQLFHDLLTEVAPTRAPFLGLLHQQRATSRRSDSSDGKIPTTSLRLRISLFRRSKGFVECSWRHISGGKAP